MSGFLSRLIGRQPPRPAVDEATGGPETHASRALAALFDEIDPEAVPGIVQADSETLRDRRVLDLGQAIGSNVEFLSPYSVQVQVGDLYRSLGGHDAEAVRRFFRNLGADANGFDLIFLWDLLNFLQSDGVEFLAEELTRLAAPGCHLFLFVYADKTMPGRPTRFRFKDRGTLTYEFDDGPRRACPRIPPAKIEQVFEGFDLDHSYRLKHGLEEYLFVRRDEA